MQKPILIFLLALLIMGCDLASDMQEMNKKQADLQQVFQDTHGWEAQIGWNIHNGVFTRLTVRLDAGEIGDRTVSHVVAAAKEAAAKVFQERPEVLVVQVVSNYENE